MLISPVVNLPTKRARAAHHHWRSVCGNSVLFADWYDVAART